MTLVRLPLVHRRAARVRLGARVHARPRARRRCGPGPLVHLLIAFPTGPRRRPGSSAGSCGSATRSRCWRRSGCCSWPRRRRTARRARRTCCWSTDRPDGRSTRVQARSSARAGVVLLVGRAWSCSSGAGAARGRCSGGRWRRSLWTGRRRRGSPAPSALIPQALGAEGDRRWSTSSLIALRHRGAVRVPRRPVALEPLARGRGQRARRALRRRRASATRWPRRSATAS